MISLYKRISALLAVSFVLVACGGSTSSPQVNIPASVGGDSLVYVLSQGDSLSRMDTVLLSDGGGHLEPDTSLYHSLYILYPQSDSVLYYTLQKDVWQEGMPQAIKETPLKRFPFTTLTDIKRMSTSTTLLSQRAKTCFVFANLEGRVLTKAQRQSLKARYPKDSISYVYMYLTPRDSLVKVYSQRDSLHGTFVSDSLGDVARLRQQLGIAGSIEPRAFIIDSTQRILSHQ